MKPPAAALLDDLGVEYRLIRLRGQAVTVQDVLDNSEGDVSREEICKTIIVKGAEGERYAIFLKGSDRISFSKLKPSVGKVSVVSHDEVLETAGAEPGAVCPLTLKIPVYLDERVLRLKRINFGSGDHLYGIEMRTADLARALSFKVLDLAE